MEGRELLYGLKQLDNILDEKKCLIYGAGRVAKAVVRYASGKGYRLNGILVSNVKNNPLEIMGISVIELKKYTESISSKCLIVATMENLHNELESIVSGYEFEKVYFISNILFKEICYFIREPEIDYGIIDGMIREQEKRLLRFIPRPCLEYLVLNILDHCNLRCKGCDHFACIAEPYFVGYETIHRDLDRLSYLFHGDYINRIAVMGGEPLLHPDLLMILKDVREHFPYTTIRLTTNGILLLKQGDNFWEACRDNRITIVNTKYPINLDFNKMKEKAKREGVEFKFFEGTGDEVIKKSFKKIINLKGDSNPVESFANCHISNYGNFLMEGKLYGCPFSCQSYRIFNQKFHQNLRITEKDYLDIYHVDTMEEIFEFASRPKYYCRYCKGLSQLNDWERSKGEISEWVDCEG